MTSIGYMAFNRCSSLTSVTIPNSVTSIEPAAFQMCSSLTSVTIGNSVTSIGYMAFNQCSSLTSVIIPSSVMSIGESLFSACNGLTSINVEEGNTHYDSRESCNAIIETATNSLIAGCKTTIIPNSVTSIGDHAFYVCRNLTSITIPNSVTSIGNYTFSLCVELKEVYCYAEQVPTTDAGAFEDTPIDHVTLYVPASAVESYRTTAPWSGFKNILKIGGKPEYTLTYKVDGEVYKTSEVEEGDAITPEPAPTKEGYTFFGWSEIPSTMPAEDVTITGTFTTNKYKLIYKVDGEEYKTSEVEYGASITAEAEPTKDGYTFSGWSTVPETMPAHDVTITGTFSIIKYKLTYQVDGEVYKSSDVEPGAAITAEATPTKEGYTFSGWSEIPATMPAEDVTITGTFTVNTYKLIYMVDDEEYRVYEVEYGTAITPEAAPTKDNHVFSGWSSIPQTMPARDVTITGTFTYVPPTEYTITYLVDGEEYHSASYYEGESVTPESEPTKDGYTFSGWSWIPSSMPGEDVTVTGTFTINTYKLVYKVDGEEYKVYEIEYGASITAEAEPTKDGYDFSGWSEIPETMPAEDVTVTGSFERRYDVGNVVDLINLILGNDIGDEDLALYDMNGDGELNIGDIILIVRNVLNNTNRSAVTRAEMNGLAPDLTQYTAAQFVLNVPADVREQDIQLVRSIEQTHRMMCRQIESGVYAVVVYSLTNRLLMPENGSIIEVNTAEARPEGLSIQDVVLAKPSGETKRYENMPVVTAISDVEREDEHRSVYDLKGQKQNRIEGLQKGVYIEKGKKIVVR